MDLNFITNHVLFEVREGVAYITLNDPEHLNPVTAEVTQDLVPVSYTHLTLPTTPYV